MVRVLILVALTLGFLSLSPLQAEEFAHYEFRKTWERTDLPVQLGQAARTWMRGPAPLIPRLWEKYSEAEGGARSVQYFDKTRME